MKAILLEHANGERHLAFVVPTDFDTQAWADTKAFFLRFLGVVRVVESER